MDWGFVRMIEGIEGIGRWEMGDGRGERGEGRGER
jgi:hypothetical protein